MTRQRAYLIPVGLLALLSAACGSGGGPADDPAGTSQPTATSPDEPAGPAGPAGEDSDGDFEITSEPLSQTPMGSPFTCDGTDINPPVTVRNVPEGTAALAIVMDDPDAPGGTFLHWQVSNIDPAREHIEEDSVPPEAVEGGNDFGNVGYNGPCPPEGQDHRYVLSVYALSEPLDPPDPEIGAEAVRAVYQEKALARADLTTNYAR